MYPVILTFGCCEKCGSVIRVISSEDRLLLDNSDGHREWHADLDKQIQDACGQIIPAT